MLDHLSLNKLPGEPIVIVISFVTSDLVIVFHLVDDIVNDVVGGVAVGHLEGVSILASCPIGILKSSRWLP